MNRNDLGAPSPAMDAAALHRLGEGQVAYVRPMTSEEFRSAFPDVADIPEGLRLFALLSAGGAPIVLAPTREAAVANAWENDLATVSLH